MLHNLSTTNILIKSQDLATVIRLVDFCEAEMTSASPRDEVKWMKVKVTDGEQRKSRKDGIDQLITVNSDTVDKVMITVMMMRITMIDD